MLKALCGGDDSGQSSRKFTATSFLSAGKSPSLPLSRRLSMSWFSGDAPARSSYDPEPWRWVLAENALPQAGTEIVVVSSELG